MSDYKFKQIILRMKLNTYRRLRELYPAMRGESAASYFERLSKWLAGVMIEWDGYDAA